MPRFFISHPPEDIIALDGETAQHMVKSLRMKKGDVVTICDGQGYDYTCKIMQTGQTVVLAVLKRALCDKEPSVHVHLYQAMPKGDKFSYIIQKSIELGVYDVTPVMTSRCVSRPNAGSMKKKQVRFAKIAHEAAKQCGRGIIPQVYDAMDYRDAVDSLDTPAIICYECGNEPFMQLIPDSVKELSLFIGAEGGFTPQEVDYAVRKGVKVASLGKRILRCETAPLAALCLIMAQTGDM